MTGYDGPIAGHGTAAQRLVPTVVMTGGCLARVGDLVRCDATQAAFTVSLPTAPLDGSPVGAQLFATSGNAVTLQCGGSDVFGVQGGATSIMLAALDEGMVFQYSAAAARWDVTANTSSFTQSDSRYLGGAAAMAIALGV